MKVYTKTGDQGTTSLLGGKRVPKYDLRIEAYGTVDELNSHVGYLRDLLSDTQIKDALVSIQETLFTMGSHLASETENMKFEIPKLSERSIQSLELAIDKMEGDLPPLRNFILPGGHVNVSATHICRTVCRRAERRVIEINEEEKRFNLEIQYLNRLSDYFFVLSRFITKKLSAEEIPWNPK